MSPSTDGEENDAIFDAFNIHHQSLKTASLHLLNIVATFRSCIQEILENDITIGNSWDEETIELEKEIKEMADRTGAELDQFLQAKDGGWKTVTGRWKKRVSNFLKDAPVLGDE